MPKIDPSARVSLHAQLAADVRVGPWTIVGPRVRLAEGCVVDSCVVIEGRTEAGPRNHFHHGAVVGTAPQDLKYKGAPSTVVIGSDNVFREYCTVNRATGDGEATVIGNGNLIMAYAHIAHNCRVGDHAILANSVNLAGHVDIADYAIIGGVTPVHQFVKIGCHSIIGGGSRVPVDVAPYVKAAGNELRLFGLNRIGLERRGFAPERVTALDRLYRIFFRSKLLLPQAVEAIRHELPPLPEIDVFLRFVEQSERGLARPRPRR